MPVPRARFTITARDADGNVKWVEEVDNLVTTGGRTDVLDKYFKGSSYSAAWYMGLIDNSGFSALSAGDTMSSHGGWTESTAYDEAVRQTLSFGTAASGSLATSSSCVFTISSTVTINGVFVSTSNTKGGTTGILYNAVSFAAPRAMVDNDTLSVDITYTTS